MSDIDKSGQGASDRMFDGTTVVVTGGGAGLGRQYCLDLGRAGANVVVAGRGGSAAAVAAEIRAEGGGAVACVADVRDGQRIIDCALATYGRVDGVIVNAGIVRDRSFGKLTTEDWSEVLSVHIDGAVACAKAVWGPMSGQKSGRILFTTSGAGMHGNFGQANYAAAKGAIIGLTRSLAIEGAARGIYVNAIAPMATTAMTSLDPRVFQPDPESRRVYDRLYTLYRRLHDAFGIKGSQGDLFDVMKELLQIRDEVRHV